MRFGLVINPIAGMGGRVGLKGTDGIETLKKAISRGAEPRSGDRAHEMLEKLVELDVKWYTWGGEMGEDVLQDLGFDYEVLGEIEGERSTAKDTKRAVEKMADEDVDLIIFVGGDGTAVDIQEAIDMRVPVVGVPSGVKMYSAVFARTPRVAASLLKKYVKGEAIVSEREVMDIDEEMYRKGRLSATLKGYLKTPFMASYVLSEKSASGSPDVEVIKESIAARVVEDMDRDRYYVLGPGSTVGAIAEELEVDKTLLGVDVIKDKKLVVKDANEKDLLDNIDKDTVIIVSPLGGQGTLLGHGNQQISPEVIKKVGVDNIRVIATSLKLKRLKALTVDTGDPELDEELRGYIRVVVGYHEEKIIKVI